jgi:5-methylcytosine-specific restriction endonuclease McrA
MKLPFCVACLAKEDLQHHHLITREEGGGNEKTNLITLCVACHHKMHRRQRDGTYSHSDRTRAGIARARAQGKRIGRPALDPALQKKIAKGLSAGLP